MANRYWVGGAGNWSSTNTTNWSTTSGGAGGASVPGLADTPIFDANSGSGIVYFYNGGVTVGATTINNSAIELRLSAAFTSSGTLTITAGAFTTNSYSVTATSLSSSNSNTRTITLYGATVTLSGSSPVGFATSTGLTFNAGTSQINCTATAWTFNGGSQAFYNVSFTSTAQTSSGITGTNTFNNLTVAGRTSAGIDVLNFTSDQTINGTLRLSAGTNATMRTFVRSDVIGTTRTLTCAAVASPTDIDFRDITIAGAAAPVSGTRLGDCKGNSGITFDAAKTVYYASAIASSWGQATANWALTAYGGATQTAFPLAQDTAVFLYNVPNIGVTVTINAAYNIGTIDMSARTSNTMTLAIGVQLPTVHGNWVNGTGTTVTGSGTITFAGRASQTITSAGKTWVSNITVNSPGGSVTLQDAINANFGIPGIVITQGTFDANGYNVTSPGISSSNSNSRSIAIGSGTWTLSSGSPWVTSTATNLTVTGTGTISLTSASAKTFAGGGIQTYPTLNQGGTGTLTVTGSNKFAGLTNTAIGSVLFTGGTTNEFTNFNLNGTSAAARLTVSSTNTTQATLKKGPAWTVGAGSLDSGNNTGLSFSGTSPNYLNISYINGISSALPTGNFLMFF